MLSLVTVLFYLTPAGRAPARDFLADLPARMRAQILVDVDTIGR